MRKSTLNMLLVLVLMYAFGISKKLHAQTTKQPITVEWIYSDSSSTLTVLPRFFCFENNTALLLDRRQAREKREFEIYNPKTGKIKKALDQEKALTSLNALLSENGAWEALDWPQSIDKQGRSVVYLIGQDIFLLDLQKSEFQRITETEAGEKNVNFAPDGNMLSFVRDNDLFVYDLKQKTEKRLTTDGSATLMNGTVSWVYWE